MALHNRLQKVNAELASERECEKLDFSYPTFVHWISKIKHCL